MRSPSSTLTLALLVLGIGASQAPLAGQITSEALELRNLGIAQLENELEAEAAETFARLATLAAGDPIGPANRAVALLRAQDFEGARAAAAEALERAPGRGDLLAIQADIEALAGNYTAALELYEQAARKRQNDPERVYALYRHSEIVGDTEEGRAAASWALDRLAELRPENLVVLLQRGQRAIAAGDRATASETFLRLRELVWAAPADVRRMAEVVLPRLMDALEANELEHAAVPARQLENVLKGGPTWKSSLQELYNPIQGTPVTRFTLEPPADAFGDGVAVTLEARRLAGPVVPGSLLAADWDGDDRAEIATLTGDGADRRAEVRSGAGGESRSAPATAGERLLLLDLDNDRALDLVVLGGNRPVRWLRGLESGGFEPARELTDGPWLAAAPVDFDSEGDLDLAGVDARGRLRLLRNRLEDVLDEVGDLAFPAELRLPRAARMATRDLDRDGDRDLLVAGGGELLWLDNLRQGRFADRTSAGGLAGVAAETFALGDLDNDGYPDLLTVDDGALRLWRNQRGRFVGAAAAPSAPGLAAVTLCDLDNDGRLDLAAGGAGGARAWLQRGTPAAPAFEPVALAPSGEDDEGTGAVTDVACADADGDRDLDLFVASERGVFQLTNRGGHENHALRVRLSGLDTGNDKNNVFGYGATLEVRRGDAYQLREADGPVTHFGIGSDDTADLLRVVWNNGVPQNRIRPGSDQTIVEEQVLKGSCPFLYTWNGERMAFVTDLLWGAPIGMPVGEGVWAEADPHELVVVPGAVPRTTGPFAGRYDLRITEELWEAAYFDLARLWVVDHPEGTEAASSLRAWAVFPEGSKGPDRLHLTARVEPVVGAWDGAGRDVTARVRARDAIYADGYPVGDYQGITPEPWSFTFDLGPEAAAAARDREPLRLLLDGWIFPADASLNVASAQRRGLERALTRLEVEVDGAWRPLIDPLGFPAGKTKTMVVDLPDLSEAAPDRTLRLRIVSSRWLHWDRIGWSTEARDSEARVVAQLDPERAELRYRGFSKLRREAPNAPHVFDYQSVTEQSPWLPMEGRFTRYGDVAELLSAIDDRLVVLGAGDEIEARYDARDLPPPPPGWRRTVLLESFGWDKDADRNTWESTSSEPLPFGAMSGYPYAEPYPADPALERWREEWLTRRQR